MDTFLVAFVFTQLYSKKITICVSLFPLTEALEDKLHHNIYIYIYVPMMLVTI